MKQPEDFIQNRFFTQREILFLEDGISYRKRTFGNTVSEFFIPYEEVDYQKIYFLANFYFIFMLVGVASAVILILQLFTDGKIYAIYLIPLLIAAVGELITRVYYAYIPTLNHGDLMIYSRRPSAQEVKYFLNELRACCKNYLYKKYAVVDKYLPIESQMINYAFLKEKRVISEEEYEQLKAELLQIPSQITGFRKN